MNDNLNLIVIYMLPKHMQLYFGFRKQLAAMVFEMTNTTVPIECPAWINLLKSCFI